MTLKRCNAIVFRISILHVFFKHNVQTVQILYSHKTLIQEYFLRFPGLFVVVSWISFMVPPDVIPGRLTLLITLFLVLVNIFNSVTTNTPKAEGNIYIYECVLNSITMIDRFLNNAYNINPFHC